jgi:hypothetical protein
MQSAMRVRLWGHVDFGWREDPEGVAPDVVTVPTLHVVYADEKRIIHHAKLLEKLGVAAELFSEERTLLRTELEFLASINPIEVFEHRTRVLTGALLGVYSTNGATFEVVGLMNILMGWEKVIHDHEMDLAPAGKFDAV